MEPQGNHCHWTLTFRLRRQRIYIPLLGSLSPPFLLRLALQKVYLPLQFYRHWLIMGMVFIM